MGTLRSTTDMSGTVVNGCTLGLPVVIDDVFYWDHSSIPNGEILEDGTIVVDEPITPVVPEPGE